MIRALAALLMLTVGASLEQTTATDLDAWVSRAMQTFEVPGLALAVVKDGRVVIAKGYGVRRLGDAAKVDERTLFGIASNTKAFTATALGLLVEEGKIEWDAPVVRYLPSFAMWDPYVTRELTVRDLLVHRSGLGLGAGDLLWWPESTYDRKEIARRLRYIPPATSFRTAYAYDNVLYLVAGELIESVSGQSWEDFVGSRILKKVGMGGSNVRHSAAATGGNIAAPHAQVDGKVRPIRPFDSDNTNPAGGINSSAEDITKWMQVQLAGGVLSDGSRLFSPATARQLTAIVTPMPLNDPPEELAPLRANFAGYALGFNIRDYRGRRVVMHSGGLPGYLSRVIMVPDLQLGVAGSQTRSRVRRSIRLPFTFSTATSKRRRSIGSRPSTNATSVANEWPAKLVHVWRRAAMRRRSRHYRSRNMPEPTATPGTEISLSPTRMVVW